MLLLFLAKREICFCSLFAPLLQTTFHEASWLEEGNQFGAGLLVRIQGRCLQAGSPMTESGLAWTILAE